MPRPQREARFLKMIERYRSPAGRRVAVLALWAVATFVYVVGAMAPDTGTGDCGVEAVVVASRTGYVRMQAGELEVRHGMIEPPSLPVALVMAVAADFTEPAFMHVFHCMARDAGIRCITIGIVRLMAIRATRQQVRTHERKVRVVVIEGADVEVDDLRVTPLMIGMTGRALLFQSRGITPVKAPFALNVRADADMAKRAELTLRQLGQRGMAVLALGLETCVRLDQCPGHDQLLNGGRAAARRYQCRQ